jgi:N utilization substance protein B
MGSRRQSRESALQMLYMVDNCNMDMQEALNSFKQYLPKEESYKDFAVNIFNGVDENKELINELIRKNAANWEIDRMAVIDRNIIRIALYEIMFMPETPINVIIDEAIEISKQYSTKDSSKFINGILDKLKKVRQNS